MGNKKQKKIAVLIVLCLLSSIFVYQQAETKKVVKPANLQTLLGPVPGYQVSPNIPLDDATYAFLELDDYTQSSYQKNGRSVDLYIGYYFTLDKISAAHSPLVCFPGQGWTLTAPRDQHLQIGQHIINYEEMTATLEQHKQLVIYWYQAHEKTVTQIYRNKLNALLNQLTGDKQEHAFVRVTVPIDASGVEEARTIGRNFIAAFYPVFLTYINSSAQYTQ